MRELRKLSIVLIMLTAVSCSTVGEAVNPYKAGFNCPFTDKGKCADVASAYSESVQGKAKEPAKSAPRSQAIPATAYEYSRMRKLAALIEEPETPLLAPPKIMRVLLLPYKGQEKELYLYRYIYFVADDASWVLDDAAVTGDH